MGELEGDDFGRAEGSTSIVSTERESVSATTVVDTPAEVVFAVLTDPATHAAIDGTGWVRGAEDRDPITAAGQVFRVGMFHEDHPDGSYETSNLVVDLDPPRVIAWRTGYVSEETGELEFGGWVWRYDLTPLGPDRVSVTHTYDWSAVGPGPRRYLGFPPFPPDHLARSLQHLAALAEQH